MSRRKGASGQSGGGGEFRGCAWASGYLDLAPTTLFVLKMNKKYLFCVAVSTLVLSAQDSTASPCRVGGGLGGPFSLAVPHVPVAVTQTHP